MAACQLKDYAAFLANFTVAQNMTDKISGTTNDPRPLNAAEAIIAAFDKYPTVALGESHGWQEQSDFILSLIRNPAFRNKVNDIVVEAGNAKYQRLADNYVAGGPVSVIRLRQVWRNTVGAGASPVTDGPNEKLFATIRIVNQSLPVAKRLRILLGDPPIDWSKVHRPEDIGPWLEQRDLHYAEVVEKEVLARGRKALLIMGSYHFLRQGFGDDRNMKISNPVSKTVDSDSTAFTMPARDPKAIQGPGSAGNAGKNVVQLMEERRQGSVFVAIPHSGYGDPSANSELEAELSAWPVPSLAGIEGTWLGKMDAGPLFAGKVMLINDGKVTEVYASPQAGKKLEDLADAYLYLGPKASMTRSLPQRSILRDKAYLRELNRRSKIISGHPFNPEVLALMKRRLHDHDRD